VRPTSSGEIRVARIIARLNIGGPAIQAITLTKRMEERGFRTLLLRGSEGPREGNMDHLAQRLGVQPVRVPAMRRDPGPGDLVAFIRLVRELRRFRPHIVHTHAAKAGTLGRAAALVAFPRRLPVLVHTFHGHSLEGYFPPLKARLFLAIERFLARRTSALVAVSEEVKADLVRLGVAPADQVRVIPLGFDLSEFEVSDEERAHRRAAKREQWGIPADAPLITLIARLVPIKRVDRFLRIAARLAEQDEEVRFAIVGDGELGEELRRTPEAVWLNGRLVWTGFDLDVPGVCFASDVVALTSDNEGTPVSLVEAQAAGVPVVATRVGGVGSARPDGTPNWLIAVDDEAGFATALLAALRTASVDHDGHRRVVESFDLERLLDRLENVYRFSALGIQ
jgi:glycosyltransferase involved in cell wall biosynthesis